MKEKNNTRILSIVARKLKVTCAAVITISTSAQAQIYNFEAYEKEIDKTSTLSALPQFSEFGDNYDPSTGAVSFRKTLVSINGNNDLRVAADYIIKLQTKPGFAPEFVMEQDLPYIEGTHSSDYGWVAGYAPTNYNNNRCSDPRALSQGAATIRILKPLDNITPEDYWGGNTLYVPGEQGGYIRRIEPNEMRPSTLDIKWATNSGWRFSCYQLPDGSEGFVGHRQNGQKYYFGIPSPQNANVQILSPNRSDVDGWLDVDKFRMYVTRIEDIHGNWVNYNENQIISSDGRSINFSSKNGAIHNVETGGRTWLIQNTSITNPDNSTWQFSKSGGFQRSYSNLLNTCSAQANIPMLYTGTMTAVVNTESGASGTFVFNPVRRGFSNVYFECNVANSGHKSSNNYSRYMHFIDDISLVSRTVSGPGIETYTHTFDYGPINACYATNHPLNPEKCTAQSPTTRTTTITAPDGTIKILKYGNEDYVNSGLLLSVSNGGIEEITMEYAKLYENANGTGMNPVGFDVSSYQINRVRRRVIKRDGIEFITEIPYSCGSGSDLCYDNFHRPTKIISTNSSSQQATTPAPPLAIMD